MRGIYCLLGALALTAVASVATASIESDVTVKSSCSQPKVATTVTTQAVPQTTVATYTVPATVVETPAQQLVLTVPGERVEIPARTVAVQTTQSVATQAVTTQATAVQTQTATDVDTTVWKKDRLRTLLANRHKDDQRLTTQTVTTVQTQTVDTECKRKRLRDRLKTQTTALDGIELDP